MSATSTAEAGRTTRDDLLHAVRPGLAGPKAVCGAGPISSRVPGRFDASAERTCPTCAAQVR